MTKLSAILKQLIAEDNINASELARLTDTFQPVMHRIITGDTDNPRIDTLLPIARYFGITVDQLVGEFPLPLYRQSSKDRDRPYSWLNIPLLSWQDLAKFPHNDKSKKQELIATNTQLSEHSYALRVKDSTMSPRFTEGTLLFVDPQITPENGDFAIIELEPQTEPTFKQVFFDGSDVYLKPLNSDFKTVHVDKNSKYRFLGVVVESTTTLKQKRQ